MCEDSHDGELNGDPTTDFPALLICLEQRKNSADEITPYGRITLWLPIWLNDKVLTCIEIVSDAALTLEARQVIDGILSVYRNYKTCSITVNAIR